MSLVRKSKHLVFLAALLLPLLLLGASPGQEGPPHDQPGPAADRILFKAVHMDLAPAELEAGNLDLYMFSLKTAAARKLADNPQVTIYRAPATTFSLILNPAPAPQGQLNPFSIKEVRHALQFIINRDFVAQEVFQGMAVPMASHVSPFDFDYLTVFDLLKESNIRYDPDLAKDLVSQAMTEAGAVLEDDYWTYQGKRITLKFIVRTEDERRDIGDLLRAELEKLGFFVAPIYQQFGPAISTVYSTDPQLFQWHLYTEGWGRGAPDRYDFSTINQMCAPWLGNMPGWQEVGYWQYQAPQLDELGKRLFTGDFTGLEERNRLYVQLTQGCLDESVRLGIATVVNSFPAQGNLVGVTEDVVAGPKGPWTLREAFIPGKTDLTVGNLWVWTERTTWNPVGGFGDVYSVDIWRQISDPGIWAHPFTGVPMPFRLQYEVDTAGPDGKLAVPADAVTWDADAGEWRSVGSGVQATSKVTFDYSKYVQSKWHHGQPITMADVLYSIYQLVDMVNNPDKSKIEVALAFTNKLYVDTFRGFRILDDSTLEVYVDFWHFVPDYIAQYANLGTPSMPWEVLAAMDDLVFQKRQAAYSDTAAARLGGVPWLSLVMDRDARQVRRTLQSFAQGGSLPQEVFTLGGKTYVRPEEAAARYEAAISWFNDHGNMVIGNGPFMLVRFNAPAQFAQLDAFRDPTYPFKPGQWSFGKPQSIEVRPEDVEFLEIGSPFQLGVELDGPGEVNLRYLLRDPASGEVLKASPAEVVSPSRLRITLSEQETAELVPGLYQLFLAAYSDQLSVLVERRLDIEAVTTLPQQVEEEEQQQQEETPTPQPTATPTEPSGGCSLGRATGDMGLVALLALGLLVVGARRRARAGR